MSLVFRIYCIDDDDDDHAVVVVVVVVVVFCFVCVITVHVITLAHFFRFCAE